jgi:ACR3 family arsenite transporter
MGLFERYLSVWVAVSIVIGVSLGNFLPAMFSLIAALEFAHVNIVVAVLIWVMIYPMMVQIDFGAIKNIGQRPFTMAALGTMPKTFVFF